MHQKTQMISLSFTVSGKTEDINLPPPLDQHRREDKLWQSTCFELFISQNDRPGYYELNFSPSANWQSYYFSQYRTDRHEAQDLTLLKSQVSNEPNKLHINLELAFVSRNIDTRHLNFGVSAILHDQSGDYHYYSLGHPPKADFHDKKYHLISLVSSE